MLRNDARAVEGLAVQRAFADTADPDSLARAMQGVDVVYHTAAQISIDGDRGGTVTQTNVEGTRNVLSAALRADVRRVIHFSSIHAIDAHAAAEVNESLGDACELASKVPAYDRSKALGEREVHEAIARGVDAVIVNPSAIIGPYDFKPSRVGRLLIDLYYRRMPSLVSGGYDWVDVRDVAESAIAAEHRGRTGERYLLSGTYATLAHLAELAASVTGVRPPRFVAPLWLAKVVVPFARALSRISRSEPLFTAEALRALGAVHSVSSRKATTELGHSPRPLEESVRDTYAWLEHSGMLGGNAGSGAGMEAR